ncbi:MAG: MerR family transcriptional regulator [Chloroflexi bacterium]|nr:MAG: MerR family transcriptional regulator [Chloroflexota bacterium]
MGTRTWRTGELARETGLTVRALRHYEHEGLLVPSSRTDAGHRVYSNADVARLYEILVLRRIGLGLAAIREQLDSPRELRDVVAEHLAQTEAAITRQQRLAAQLRRVHSSLEFGQLSSEALLRVMEDMTMLERYLSTEQMERLREHRSSIGIERIQAASVEQQAILTELDAARVAGIDPQAPHVLEMIGRLKALFLEFVGEPELAGAMISMVEREGAVAATHGLMSEELGAYMSKAIGAGSNDAHGFDVAKGD